jgi:hypothetical protein
VKEEEKKNTTSIGMLIAIAVAVIAVIAFGVANGQKNDAENQLGSMAGAVEKYKTDWAACESQLKAAYAQEQDSADRVELVYIVPKAGCGDICEQMRAPVESAAEQLGFYFRPVLLPANISLPGMYVLSKDTMSEIFPINSESAMNFVFCNKFNLTERCIQAPVDTGAPAEPDMPVNNTAPEIDSVE